MNFPGQSPLGNTLASAQPPSEHLLLRNSPHRFSLPTHSWRWLGLLLGISGAQGRGYRGSSESIQGGETAQDLDAREEKCPSLTAWPCTADTGRHQHPWVLLRQLGPHPHGRGTLGLTLGLHLFMFVKPLKSSGRRAGPSDVPVTQENPPPP